MTIINAIKRILLGADGKEKAEWLRKEFIPVYRRLIDAMVGRCSVHRALNTANHMIITSGSKLNWAPVPMHRVLLEMKASLEKGHHHENADHVLLEVSEALLDEYLIANQEVKLA